MEGSERRQLGEQQASPKAAASGNELSNGCGSLQSRMSRRIQRQTQVSCKARFRSMHKEIPWYFSEIDRWDGIGTIKKMLGCFFHKVLGLWFFLLFITSK